MSRYATECLWYHKDTGEVKEWTQSGSPFPLDYFGPDLIALEVETPQQYMRTHFVKDGALTPIMTMTPTIVGTVISDLPIPCRIKTNKVTFDVDDGTAELEYPFPGTYDVEITAANYHPYKTTVTA